MEWLGNNAPAALIGDAVMKALRRETSRSPVALSSSSLALNQSPDDDEEEEEEALRRHVRWQSCRCY